MGSKKADAGVRQATASILLVKFGFAFCNTSMAVLINPVIEEFGLSGAGQGLPASLNQAGSLLCVLLVPFIAGRVRKLTMLAFGAVLQAAMTFLTGVSPAFFLVLAAFSLVGVGGGIIDVYASAGVIDLHRENSAPYMGIVHGLYGAGAIVTPLVVQGLLFAGWRGVYLITAVPLAVFAVMMVRTARRGMPGGESRAEKKPGGRQLWQYLRRGQNLALAAGFVFYSAGQFGMMGWLVRYMTVQFDAEAMGAVAVALFWAGSTINRFTVPRLRLPPLALIMAGLGAGAVLHLLGVLAARPAALLVAAGLVGLASGHVVPMMIEVAARLNPGDTALPTAVLMLCNKLAVMLMPLVLGAVSVASMPLSMGLGAGCMALALACVVLAVRRPVAAEKAGKAP